MSSRLPRPSNRRRIDRIGGGVLAVLGLVVAVVAVVALRHPNGRQARPVALRTTSTTTVTATATPTAAPSNSPSSPSNSPSPAATSIYAALQSIPLAVLNNTFTPGLAETAKQRFESAGWTVTSTGNITNDILSTCAYYDPSDPANEQAALQLQQQFPEIKRVKERFAELPSGPIIVVLTADYS
jgi:ABC-type transport system substrate-binding protein